MDTLYQNENKEKGSNKVLFAAIGIAILAVAAIIGLLFLRPTTQEVKTQVLDGAYREGSPEFQALTNKIIIFNDAENTMESPVGLGTITMFTRSRIRNNSDKTITALEIKVGVVDPMDKVIREKTVTVVPSQNVEAMAPQQIIPVGVPIEGFSKEDDRARVQWKVTAIKTKKMENGKRIMDNERIFSSFSIINYQLSIISFPLRKALPKIV